ASMGVVTADAAMIGDDVEADVAGAVAAGLQGILVRTGKYRRGDEDRLPVGARCADDVMAALGLLSP
ncbi:MAG: HAD hydrolase-like protein, partial [Perlucidibaca sp.]